MFTRRSAKDEVVHTRREVIQWWEARRIRYNFVVGIVGVGSVLAVLIFGAMAVKDGVDFEEPVGLLLGPIIFGILANFCYTLGWISDMFFFRGKPRRGLWLVGTTISVLLAALPGTWVIIAWVGTVITGYKLD